VSKWTSVLTCVLLFWIVVVFYFGTRNAIVSSKQARWAYTVLKKIDQMLDFSQTELFTKIRNGLNRLWFGNKKMPSIELVRKSAHFGLYMILGIVAFWFALVYSRSLLIATLMGVSLAALVASLDEYFQQFRGRGASLNDVVIDISGALTGTILCLIVFGVVKLLRTLSKRRMESLNGKVQDGDRSERSSF